MNGDLAPVKDVSVADWIAARLSGPLGTVGSVVPRGFAAYARVLHPVEFDDGRATLTWARVCQLTGRTAHALMQWSAITTPTAEARVARELSAPWKHCDVRVGNLAPSALGALIDVLAPVTGGHDCFHALWEGWGWVDGSGVRFLSSSRVDHVPAPNRGVGRRAGIATSAFARRDYLLFRGPLPAALDMGWPRSPRRIRVAVTQSAWPANHSWCVSTEIDFDSTLVGGSADLIDAVLTAPGLDAWPVEPDDDLTAFADLPNR